MYSNKDIYVERIEVDLSFLDQKQGLHLKTVSYQSCWVDGFHVHLIIVALFLLYQDKSQMTLNTSTVKISTADLIPSHLAKELKSPAFSVSDGVRSRGCLFDTLTGVSLVMDVIFRKKMYSDIGVNGMV